MPETKRLTLYSALDSPFVHRVRLALEEAGAKYNMITIDTLEKPNWYEQKVYPNGGKVPLLVYGGPELHPDEAPSPDAAKVAESVVILEFLADIFPEAHLLPADPVLRAHARLFCQIADTKLLTPFVRFWCMNGPAEDAHSVLEALQAMLPPTGFAAGEWSIADATFVPILMRWVISIETGLGTFTPESRKESLDAYHSPRFERLRKYFEDNFARPSMSKCYDEAAVKRGLERRIERIRRTGMFTSDIRVPVKNQPSD
ncbi:thioredoxin-like protein [Lenzites betulinus]|nr:thioredoxin-like protein [Lenzites betulinus]